MSLQTQVYAVINPGLYTMMFIPASQFSELFITSNETGLCMVHPQTDAYGYPGDCMDTIMQSYSVNHCRGCWARGEYNTPLLILGMYHLVDGDDFKKYIEKYEARKARKLAEKEALKLAEEEGLKEENE